MSDETLKTFDNLPSIVNQDVDDDADTIVISHGVGTVHQGDKKAKLNQLQQITVLRCQTAGNTADKQAEYVGGMQLKGNAQSCIGRNVLVIFDNKNTAANPTFTFGNLTGPIILLNQANNVQLGAGCINGNSRNIMTWDGENWCLHSNIAEVTSSYTKYADGTTEHITEISVKITSLYPNSSYYYGISSLPTFNKIKSLTVKNPDSNVPVFVIQNRNNVEVFSPFNNMNCKVICVYS